MHYRIDFMFDNSIILVVLLTVGILSFVTITILIAGHEFGMNAYIVKPIANIALITTIMKLDRF